MFERKYADAYEFDMEKVYEMLFFHMRENEKYEYSCREDDERLNSLTERLNSLTAVDKNFKIKFINDMNDALNYVSSNSFENGLKVGVSLLKSLLTAEIPDIHITQTNIKK